MCLFGLCLFLFICCKCVINFGFLRAHLSCVYEDSLEKSTSYKHSGLHNTISQHYCDNPFFEKKKNSCLFENFFSSSSFLSITECSLLGRSVSLKSVSIYLSLSLSPKSSSCVRVCVSVSVYKGILSFSFVSHP